jgi:hypothetical protein
MSKLPLIPVGILSLASNAGMLTDTLPASAWLFMSIVSEPLLCLSLQAASDRAVAAMIRAGRMRHGGNALGVLYQ